MFPNFSMQHECNRPFAFRPCRDAVNARILAHEVTVTYPFHPLVGQAFVLAGQYQHGGVEQVLVRRRDGATFIFPAWMTANPTLGKIVAHPQLPVNRLIEVRAIVDRIMIASSARDSAGGHHEERSVCATGSVPSVQ